MNTTDDGLSFKVLPSSLKICGTNGRTLFQINPDGSVEGKVADASEAARVFADHVAQHFTRTTPSLVTDDEVERATDAIIAALGAKAGMLFSQRNANIAARAALAASDRDVLVEKAEQEISAWAFAHDIDGAIRNELFARIRAALIPLAEGHPS